MKEMCLNQESNPDHENHLTPLCMEMYGLVLDAAEITCPDKERKFTY